VRGGKLAQATSLIRQYLAQGMALLHTEAIKAPASDLRQNYDALNAGTKSSVTVYAEGDVRLTPSGSTGASHTAGANNLAATLDDTSPYTLVAWALDESQYGADLRLAKVQCYIDPQADTANPPYDGAFILEVFQLRQIDGAKADDVWILQPACSPVRVEASSITAAGLVDFTFGTSGFSTVPVHIPITGDFKPTHLNNPTLVMGGRVIVVRLRATTASNANYAWKYESGGSNPEALVNIGTLYHMTGAIATSGGASQNRLTVTAGTGMPRLTFTVNSYAASGSLTFTDIDLGAAPVGDVEFRVIDQVPPGCGGAAYASDDAGANWSLIVDGDTPADAAPALASQQTYQMKYEFAADAAQSTSPTLRVLGVVDRTLLDVTEFASWSDAQESVDPLTGQQKIADAECRLQFTGQRDYLDDATTLLATNNWDDIELRTHVYHPNLPRSEWGYLDLWSVDKAVVTGSEAVISCMSVLSRMRGKFPRPSGTQYGYLLKSTASDLSGLGGDYQKVISQDTQAGSSFVWTVGAGATEHIYFATPPGVPGIQAWMDGDWTIKLKVSSGNSNVKLAVRVKRVDAAGSVLVTRPAYSIKTAEEVTGATGTLTFTLRNLSWVKTVATLTDRLVIDVQARNTDGGAPHAITIDTGTTDTEILPPWIQRSSVAPQFFNAVTPAAAIATWVDTVIGLPARYRGSFSDRSDWTITKAVMDADGQREAERISYLDGLCLIASQGVIKQAHLWGQRGLAVHTFPLETYNPGAVDMGFGSRLPEYQVAYGLDTSIPNDFAGVVKAVHQDALDAFGRAKIDEPVPELEHETAKYVRDTGLAGEIARNRVIVDGCGDIRVEIDPIEDCPWLEIGDFIGAETDRIAFRDPVTGNSIRGPLWAFGPIVGRTAAMQHLKPRFVIKPQGLADLWVTDSSVSQRVPYEGPRVTASVTQDPNNVQNALAVLRAAPPSATIYYYYAAAGTAPPDRQRLDLWSLYASELTLARDTSADKVLSSFAVYQGFTGPITPERISASPAVTIGTLTGTEASTTVTAVGSDISEAVRRIRWYMRKHATSYPTGDGTTTGVLDETYFIAEKAVAADLGGGPSQAHTGVTYGGGDKAKVIAVPLDYLGKPGTRKALDYSYAGSSTATLSAATWVTNVTAAGSPRSIDLAWTPSGVSDVTHDLKVYAGASLIYTEVSPNSNTTATAVATGYTTGTGNPGINVVYTWKLMAGATVVDSGTFSPGYGDTFFIGDGSLAT
jgi:hypothetical protein